MLLKISRFFLYISLFSVVIVLTTAFFPFIGGKDYFFRFAVELALVFFILWWAFESKDGEIEDRFGEVFKKPLFVAVSIFVLMFLLASVFAYDPHAAFWSNYERGEGGFQMLHYYAFFVLLVLLMESKEDWIIFFKTAVVASISMVLYGVFANLGWADNFISPYQGGPPPEGPWQRLVATRFQGSLGNPAYVAPYLIFSIFYTLYLWRSSKFLNKWIAGLVYGGLSFAFFFFLLISQTRGALLGLAASIFVFLVYLISTNPKLRKWLATALIFFFVVAVLLVLNRNSQFVKDIPGGRIFNISTGDSTVQTRFWTWGSAWNGFKERPIFGWGPENFSAVFDKYFDPRHFNPNFNSETWFDRAHSVYFDYLAETGILGFLSYIAIFVVLILGVIKSTYRSRRSLVEKALIVSLPVGYLIQGVAIFDVLPMYINLFAFLAFGYFVLYRSEVNERAEQKNEHRVAH